uniref:Uncharacterized protein n=1 Tax=Romanomermis culicivorax TaxID=13658 RepID=A0A915I8X2_ROMCU
MPREECRTTDDKMEKFEKAYHTSIERKVESLRNRVLISYEQLKETRSLHVACSHRIIEQWTEVLQSVYFSLNVPEHMAGHLRAGGSADNRDQGNGVQGH